MALSFTHYHVAGETSPSTQQRVCGRADHQQLARKARECNLIGE
jgi:hypothetical protein